VVICPFFNKKLNEAAGELWVDVGDTRLPGLSTALLSYSAQFTDASSFSELFREEKRKLYLDLINIIYVAFTRPESMLYILAGKPGNNGKPTTTAQDLLRDFLDERGIWEAGREEYAFGSIVPKQAVKESGLPATDAIPFDAPGWKGRIHPGISAPVMWDTLDPERNRRWGNLVHSVISSIESADDVEMAVARAIDEGLLTNDEGVGLEKEIFRVIADPSLRPYFTAGNTVYNEREILHPSGRIYRPDRLVLIDGIMHILDYKTGVPASYHHTQLRGYASVLREMGYRTGNLVLVYLDERINVEFVNPE
jgi:ATP-dependent exoDNAse (exonuclease V) beta subunit